MATNFEPNECVNFVQSTTIGTNQTKAINSKCYDTFCSIKKLVPMASFSVTPDMSKRAPTQRLKMNKTEAIMINKNMMCKQFSSLL